MTSAVAAAAAPAIDPGELSPQAQRILGADTPAPARMMAARGILPGLKPAEIVTVVAALAAASGDGQVAEAAWQTLRKLPPPVIQGALAADLQPGVIDPLARAYVSDLELLARLLVMPRIAQPTLEYLAENASEQLGELIATNEQRMLAMPAVIEKLYMNRRVRASTASRLLELAVRNKIVLAIPAYEQAAQAIMNELVPEPSDEPTPDDLLFQEVDRLAEAVQLDDENDDTHEIDEEGEEHVKKKFLPVHAAIAQMSVTDKIRRATLGTSAERLLLVRDPNRLVASAAVHSPLMNENDAVKITASRSVSDEVLRLIALNRELTRSYQVKMNLVMNPRTPFSFAARLVPHLRDNDLRSLSRSKNVPSSIAQAVSQQLQRKQQKG
jgi:hypothetical protein